MFVLSHRKNFLKRLNLTSPSLISFASIAILAVFIIQIGPLAGRITGDRGDSRFVIEVLELNLDGLVGNLGYLDFPFFWPLPEVAFLSDTFSLHALVYGAFRFLGFDIYWSFWLLQSLGILLNFLCTKRLLRHLLADRGAAEIGALVFAVGLPAISKLGHAQLTHRWWIPILVLSILTAFENPLNLVQLARRLFRILVWLSVGFLLSPNLAFTTFIVLIPLVPWLILTGRKSRRVDIERSHQPKIPLAHPRPIWIPRGKIRALTQALAVGGGILVIAWNAVLLTRYQSASSSLQLSRSSSEILLYSPTVLSVLNAPSSLIWSWIVQDDQYFVRGENPFWIGLGALCLLVWGISRRSEDTELRWLIIGGLTPLLLIVRLGEFSLLSSLAEISSTLSISRTPGRLVLALLLPIAVLIGHGITAASRFRVARDFLVTLTILELVMQAPYTSNLEDWKQADVRLASVVSEVIEGGLLEADALVVLPLGRDVVQTGIDAIHIARATGVPTINGYSGFIPVVVPELESCSDVRHWLSGFSSYRGVTFGVVGLNCELLSI